MRNLWNDSEASQYKDSPLQLRVYTSRLLGQAPDLVLHGGGNTSVKMLVSNIFQEQEDILYVKGSGWDLATIETAGFAPVRMEVLKKLAQLDTLSDTDMVKMQKSAMLDPAAPSPSIEAILHAIIPFQYVDHTHADAIVTLTNTPNGKQIIGDLYGDRVLIIPYVMPGFILAKKIFELSRNADWSRIEGMVLMHHGVFSFANDAKTSYDNMIKLVSKAEDYIKKNTASGPRTGNARPITRDSLLKLAAIRQQVSHIKGQALLARLNRNPSAYHFSRLPNVADITNRGPLTPDHIIRTKRTPLVVEGALNDSVNKYAQDYLAYFQRNTDGSLTCLDPAPRWGVWPDMGSLAFGASVKEADIIADISAHTMDAIAAAEKLGGWCALPEKDLFEIEYWELEQAKLKKTGGAAPLQGKVALVSGAASGIGKACVEKLHQQGAAVIATDINPAIKALFNQPDICGIQCDIADEDSIQSCIAAGIESFGGLDILINNAGIFPASEELENLKNSTWNSSLAVNLTGHQLMLKHCIPFLSLGVDPAIVMVASKNVPAPGPGAAAYSVAKAGLTQLARVAALELAGKGIRVNMVHPDAVFDTAIWTDEVLQKRARHYKMNVQEYKTKNLLKVELTSSDVAELVCAMLGPAFSKTTGAQIPIDGGNDRVI